MRYKHWMLAAATVIFCLFVVGARADEEHGHGHGKHRGNNDGDRFAYTDNDREAMRSWYRDSDEDRLPPGLAKRDRLPPGLERQLMVRGTLPPGLRKRIRPCPEDLERRLPPPPPNYAHVVIGGHVILMNRRTFMVLDIFHFEQ